LPILILLILAGTPVLSQSEITEGTDYWFGIPYAKFKQPEEIRGDSPIVVWISSKVNTVAHVQNPETGSVINVSIKSNQASQVPLSDVLMNNESEIPHNLGIHITSDDPVSITVYLSYRWSGEAFRVIPLDWLGKEYVTLNLYQDETDEKKPAQILVVATQDNTEVTYTPTFDTEKCNKGNQRTVTLNQGQTFLILGKLTNGLTQNWSSDLTGTYLKATKPIAVISGHTKGAFPLYYVGERLLWGDANFSRNMLCDMMWPVELLGTEYISAPLKYNDRPRGQSGVQDDNGDLIRFVAAYDSTKIYQMRQDGSGLMGISRTMKRGEWTNITNQEIPAYYRSNKPVLVGHYGKTWWLTAGMMGPITKKDDQPQNPMRSGQGMLLVLAPIDHWCSYAIFRSPSDIDNFIYLTFRYADRDNLYFDGQKIVSTFGGGIKTINGTDYAYITEPVAAADHWIEGRNGAEFAAYAYGNWDYEKDGFAYGYPIGINYADQCPDSLSVEDKIVCGNVTGKAFAIDLQADTTCASLFKITCNANTLYNYSFKPQTNFQSGDKTFTFELTVNNLNDSAHAVIEFMTRSGRKLSKTYTYYPELVKAVPTFINFGMMRINQQKCLSFNLMDSVNIPVTVSEIKLKNGEQEFVISSVNLPYTLQPGESLPIQVCATALVQSPYPVKDSIIVKLTCYPETIVGLDLSTGEPDIYISDADWGQVPVNDERVKQVTIDNRGIVNAEIYNIVWIDSLHFTHIEGFNPSVTNPVIIKPNESISFNVYYKPDKAGDPNRDSAYFTTNAYKTKLYSIWTGIGIDVGPTITGKDWGPRRVIDEWQKNLTPPVLNYPWKITLGCIGNTDLLVNNVVIEGDPDSVFSLNHDQIPSTLSQNDPVDIDVAFAPKAEKEYSANVKLISDFNGTTKIATAVLHGIGIEPHINVVGYNFLTPIKVGESSNYENCFVEHKKFSDMTAMQLTLTNKLEIVGPDKDAFTINPAWLDNEPDTQIIPIGSVLSVPVLFTPLRAGTHHAQIVAKSDAPKTDNHVGDLSGIGYIEGIAPTNYDFPTIFITTTNYDGIVSLTNTGTTNITINKDIIQSFGGPDVSYFAISDWYLGSNQADPLSHKPQAPFDLNAGDVLYVRLSFTPLEERVPYIAYIDYQTSLNVAARSVITGGGRVLRTTCEIPKYADNPLKPGQSQLISFKYYNGGKTITETKSLVEGNITGFTATVEFNQGNNIIDIMPAIKTCPDIIKTGTMTDGWTCDNILINNDRLQVQMSGTTPLKEGPDSVLFKFNMNTFISSRTNTVINLPCTFVPNDRPYILVDTIWGDLKITPVCVNQLRLVQISNVTYSLSFSNPNPVSNSAYIDYSIGFEGLTQIIIYNEFGEKVATLIDEDLQAGSYRMNILVDALGLVSGTYYIKMMSGPFIDTKSLIVVK
jgi:hypothetical protein